MSKTTAELTIAQQAAERRNRALKSANMELSAVKAELAAAARAAVEADQEIKAAKSLGLALLEAKAARSAAEAACPRYSYRDKLFDKCRFFWRSHIDDKSR